jgi:hypothetical protein
MFHVVPRSSARVLDRKNFLTDEAQTFSIIRQVKFKFVLHFWLGLFIIFSADGHALSDEGQLTNELKLSSQLIDSELKALYV